MKKGFSFLVLGVIMFVAFAFKNLDSPKVIAVIMKAKWCKVCEANGPRMGTEVMPAFKENTKVTFLLNDLTDDKSKEDSKVLLDKFGVYNTVASETQTGQLILIDAESKKIIKKIQLKETSSKVISEIKSTL